MTSEAGRDGKAYRPRRERRAQLHEAGASALAAVQLAVALRSGGPRRR